MSAATAVIVEPKRQKRSRAADAPLNENRHVKELLGILKANGFSADAQGLTEMIGHVAAVERDLNRALGDINVMRRELSAMKDERDHPVRTMLQKAADGLAARFSSLRAGIRSLKDKIIGMCKNAVEAFKDKGVAALNGAVDFLDIKRDLESIRGRINDATRYNEGQIAKIEKAGEEFHSAGRAVKNIARALSGKELIPDIKPNGKLARLLEATFRSEVNSLNRSLRRVNKALAGIDKLEKAAALRSERDRPSTIADIREKQAKIKEQKREPRAKENARAEEAAI